MAIATRRLQAPVAPPLCSGERGAGGLRRAGLSAAPPRTDSRDAGRRVLEAAVEAGDLTATVAAIAGLTGSAVVLQDPFLTVLASAPGPAGGDGGAELALSRSGGPLVRDLLRGGGARPALVELPRHGSTPARLVARVAARGELLGFLVVGCADRTAYATLEAAAPVVALLLQAEERLCRLLKRDQRELFLDLLAGRSADCLVLQARRLGHDLDLPHWPLVFTGRRRPGDDGAGGTPSDDRLEHVVREVLRTELPAGTPAPVIGADGDAVVAFVPAEHPDVPAGVARRVRGEAARRGVAVLAGWGPRCHDLADFGAGVARARWVVDVLSGLPGDPDGAGYDDLGIYALLYEKRDHDQLADFAERWLGRLQSHAELVHTLRVLLETGGPSAAATALFVHISTLKYRLRKIESILGLDLSDPEVCFNLRLAFKIVAVRERLCGSPA